MRVLLGNIAAREPYTEEVDPALGREALEELAAARGVAVSDQDDERLAAELSAVLRYRPLPGNRVTRVGVPDGTGLAEAFITITAPGGVWRAWSTEPPAWVESDSDELAALLAAHYGCPVGRPEDWEGIE